MRPRGRRLGSHHIIAKEVAMSEKLEGIVSPSIDKLMDRVDSKYELVMFAAKRARQINDYYSALHEGSLFSNVGPLVDVTIDEKPLTIALHEVDQGLLTKRHLD
jgi:DNA-directed RNA polymerase subunit omega